MSCSFQALLHELWLSCRWRECLGEWRKGKERGEGKEEGCRWLYCCVGEEERIEGEVTC